MADAEIAVEGKTAGARDWTQGSIIRNLLALSWPMIVTESIYMVTIIDMVWVGRLGSVSMAGYGVAFIVIMLVMTVWVGLSVGARALVARSVGARDTAGANHIAQQAVIISIAYGLVMTVIGLTLSESILGLFGLQADVLAEGTAYLRIYSLVWIPLSIWLMTYAMIQSAGDTVTPLKIEIIIRASHLVLSPILILGPWIFPRLGIRGAAISSVIIETLATVLALWYLLSGRTRLRLSLKAMRPDLKTIWRILRIGAPACIMSLQNSAGGVFVMGFLVPFGTVAVAAHSLINRVGMIVGLPSYGLGLGAGVLVGQNLGAHQPGRAERSGWIAASLVQGFMVVCAIAILLWAENVIRLFNTEPDLVRAASAFFRIAAAGYLVAGFGTTLQHCISGAGDTLMPMLLSLLNMWAVTIPLAFFLPRVTDLGVYGVRWALVAPAAVGVVAYTAYFWLGRWKRKRV